MKVISLIAILLVSTVVLKAQGIVFEKGLTWKQVKLKAKAENKYIFMDCYATWCMPCKEMDQRIYPQEVIGNFFNDKFISIKLQMDTSKNDDNHTRIRYEDAHQIQQQYKIAVFPSYLFFSPEGELVHQDVGLKSNDEFISMAKNSLNKEKQYHTLLNQYKKGVKAYSSMSYMALLAKGLGENSSANKIAQDYIIGYLLLLTPEDLFTKNNLEFIKSFTNSSKEAGFNLFYNNGVKIDSVMEWRGLSQAMVDYIIVKEHIEPHLKVILDKKEKQPANEPKWNALFKTISDKYNKSYAYRTILNSQINWYNKKQDWDKAIKYTVDKIDKYGLDTIGSMNRSLLNNMIFELIFMRSNDVKILNKSLKWMEMLLEADPDDAINTDTYANILYKLGRVQDALVWERKALNLAESQAVLRKVEVDRVYQQTIDKMESGQPTWYLPILKVN